MPGNPTRPPLPHDLALQPIRPLVPDETIRIHIDGASKGNPGPAAIGVVFLSSSGEVLAEGGAALAPMTNNAAEYHGLLAAMAQAIAWGATRVEILTDSELLARQMNGSYAVKSPPLMPLFRKARELRGRFAYCAIRHIPREQNRRADELANLAIDRSSKGRHSERPK